MVQKYRKKPVVIEAVQWMGSNEKEVYDFAGDKCFFTPFGELKTETLEGEMLASVGDFIIKGINGEFYPCKPDIFEKTYELVD